MKIRVLVVDDSAVVRLQLRSILEADPRFEVVGEAADGVAAVEQTSRLRPSVVTMDVNMPRLDGVEATRAIMRSCPTPVVIVSSATDQKEARVAFRALQAGALDIIEKPAGPAALDALARRIVTSVALMSEVKVVRRFHDDAPWQHEAAEAPLSSGRPCTVVGICASTGGPPALEFLLRNLPRELPCSLVIVQHMMPGFTSLLVDWLNLTSALPVGIASRGEKLRPGRAYLAPEGHHLLVEKDLVVALSDGLPVQHHRPSGTPLFQSLAANHGPNAIGIILTGMGSDGAEGLVALRRAGGHVIAQDEKTSLIFGMPRAAIEARCTDEVLALEDIPGRLVAVGTGSWRVARRS